MARHWMVAGVYEKLLGKQCGEHRRLDPRLELRDGTPLSPRLRECGTGFGLSNSGRRSRTSRNVSQPACRSRCRGGISGEHPIPRDDSWPAWLRDHFGGVITLRILVDDTIEPVEGE